MVHAVLRGALIATYYSTRPSPLLSPPKLLGLPDSLAAFVQALGRSGPGEAPLTQGDERRSGT